MSEQMTREEIDKLTELEKAGLPAPWEAEISDDDEFIHQAIGKHKLKPLLHLAQLTTKRPEIELLVALRNSAKKLIAAARQGLELREAKTMFPVISEKGKPSPIEEIGKALTQFESALGNAWVTDQNPNASDSRMKVQWGKADIARKALWDHLTQLTSDLSSTKANAQEVASLLEQVASLCGVKIDGEITHDMIPAFVEGEIDRLDDAHTATKAKLQQLETEIEGLRRDRKMLEWAMFYPNRFLKIMQSSSGFPNDGRADITAAMKTK